MRLDNIPIPKQTELIGSHFNDGFQYIKIKNLVVEEVTYKCGERYKFPAKILQWLIETLPRCIMGGPNLCNNNVYNIDTDDFGIVKYLVEHEKFSFAEACIISVSLCRRCKNMVSDELLGLDVEGVEEYSDPDDGHCCYCEQIDPEYHQKNRAYRCYKAIKMGGDIKRTFDGDSVYFDMKPARLLLRFKWWLKKLTGKINDFQRE